MTSDYPTARTLVRNVAGGDGVQFYVSYAGDAHLGAAQEHRAAARPAEELDHLDPVNVQPDHGTAGWQIVRFVFVAGGKSSDFQVYDFYVDPRMKA